MNIGEILSKIDEDYYRILIEIGKLAQKLNQKVFLVGGIVRDLLLGYKNLDLDIVVENNSHLLIEEILKNISGSELAAKHDRFHTGKIIFNIKNRKLIVDLASTREEYYEFPGALPTVKKTDCLKEDLIRRDFTINALCVSLIPENFGEVIDLFNGLDDLKNKKIKILHEKSFIDDPTRMIRAVRFASRLGFEIEPSTKDLLYEAMNSNDFNNLIVRIRGERVKIEIRYLFNLENIKSAIELFFSSGVYKIVSTELKKKNITIADLIDKSKQWLIVLGILIHEIESNSQEKILKNLYLTNEEIKIIKSSFSSYNKLKDKYLSDSITSFKIYQILNSLSHESIAILFSLFSNEKKILEYLHEYLNKTSKIKLEITGEDLIKIGIPQGEQIKEILDKVLEEKFINPLLSKEDELRLVNSIIKI